MYQRIENRQFDSRSFIGDVSIELRDILFENDEKLFWQEYEAWKIKYKS